MNDCTDIPQTPEEAADHIADCVFNGVTALSRDEVREAALDAIKMVVAPVDAVIRQFQQARTRHIVTYQGGSGQPDAETVLSVDAQLQAAYRAVMEYRPIQEGSDL